VTRSKIKVLSFQPSGWGWTGNIPGFGLLATSFPTRSFISGNTTPPGARDVWAGGRVAAAAVRGNDGRGTGGEGAAQHRPAAQCRRQHGHRDLSAGQNSTCRSRSRAACSRSATTMPPRRRRSLRLGDREPDGCRAAVRAGEGCQHQDAALRDAGPVTDHFDRRATRVTTGIGPDLMTGRACCFGDDRVAVASASAIRRSTPTCCAVSAPTCASVRSSTGRTGWCRSTSRGSCWSKRVTRAGGRQRIHMRESPHAQNG